jgi:hypothetical protein
MANGGKGGASKGGGSKGGGSGGLAGKGNKGGGCSQGQVAACFLKSDYDLILAAFNAAIRSTSRSSGCDSGAMRVCLDLSVAQTLWTTVAFAAGSVSKTSKGKGKGGLAVGVVAKLKGTRKKGA